MERPSRFGLISLLIAAEVVIVGFAVFSLRGSAFGSSGGLHRVDYVAAPIAPVAAGLSPNVTIDDIDSGVSVTASNDGLIHVTDRTEAHGFLWGSNDFPRPVVTRTLDGVRIVRAGGHSFGVALGESRQHIDIEVPPASRVTILRSSGARLSGLHNDVAVTSQDGRITLDDITGNITAHSNDGRIVGSQLHANALDLSSDDGRIELSSLDMNPGAPKAELHTKDGPLIVSGVFPANGSYSMSTGDGHVELNLLPGSDTTVDASTGDGHVIVDGRRDAGQSIRVGAGNATMRVRTNDGSVKITTNGAQ
ncbi:MAG TPA: DUF4097 family beta strand repeat-containing protein [Candidatus Aquilonibacter sp.]|nr:DUF4097 family beta strand repeat-containing protein [Candidatus Aquilonibacter sp.]